MFVNDFGELNWPIIIGFVVFLIAIGAGTYYWINRPSSSPSPSPALIPAPSPVEEPEEPEGEEPEGDVPEEDSSPSPVVSAPSPVVVLPTIPSPVVSVPAPSPAIPAPTPMLTASGLPTSVMGDSAMAPWGRGGFPDKDARWIWISPTGYLDAPAKTYDFEKILYNNTGAPVTAIFRMHFDNEAEVFVNNVSIGTSPAWENMFSARFTLVPGNNLIRVRGINYASSGSNPAGFLASIARESDGFVLARTDASWVYRLVETATPPSSANQTATSPPSSGQTQTQGLAKINYVGCFNDKFSPRGLPTLLGTAETKDSCMQKVKSNGFKYGGLQWFGECWAGSDLNTAQQHGRQNEAECKYQCTGSRTRTATVEPECGGDLTNAVYEVSSEGFQGANTRARTRAVYTPTGNRASPKVPAKKTKKVPSPNKPHEARQMHSRVQDQVRS